MAKGCFLEVAATKENLRNNDKLPWNELIKRPDDLYERPGEMRNPFQRDYTRVLHSLAYRRLKHKTQVFFNIENDHICTRMEHVAHVESVSSTIAQYLGLNTELTKAIAIAHDLGHTPFGHQGEDVVGMLAEKKLREKFWHEKNGLRFVDQIELLEDSHKKYKNLSLTYAVRDGIISHCGEVDDNALKPREELIDLSEFGEAGHFQPITWEGCVVKLADKIAYIGRDIEDALCLKFLDLEAQNELQKIHPGAINTTVIMYDLIQDVCRNSSPEKGIGLSNALLEDMNKLKDFNNKYIYKHKRLEPFKNYSEMIIMQIFDTLMDCYDGAHTIEAVIKLDVFYNTLSNSFSKWLARYCDVSIVPDRLKQLALDCENRKIYGCLDERSYTQAVLDYISGMTDRFAIKIFHEFLAYE